MRQALMFLASSQPRHNDARTSIGWGAVAAGTVVSAMARFFSPRSLAELVLLGVGSLLLIAGVTTTTVLLRGDRIRVFTGYRASKRSFLSRNRDNLLVGTLIAFAGAIAGAILSHLWAH